MIRWIGAGMVGLCTTWLGAWAARERYQQVRKLDELEQGLFALQRELELAPVSLPQMLAQLERCCVGSGGALFGWMRQGMEQLEEKTVSQIWQESLDRLEPLPPEGRRCLQPLGGVLGGYGALEQVQAVSVARQQLENVREQCYDEVKKQGNVYRVLGVTVGCFLILLCL